DNPIVKGGITLTGLKWALFSAYASNWHPLTWISHMLDCEFYGLKPWGHHLTNMLLHTVNSVLLCLVLFRMTGAKQTPNSKLQTPPSFVKALRSGREKLQIPSSNKGLGGSPVL